jgi:hypothetical protein
MNKTFKINYLTKDFQSIKDELKKYAKRYYSDEFSDLSEASINSFMIDAAAYVGDVLSYYTDYQANESILATAIDDRNIQNLAKSLGFKQASTTTTAGKLAVFMLIPTDGFGNPDYSSVPIIQKGTTFTTADNTREYLLNEDVVIDENLIGTNYVVARTNDAGNPTYFAIKFYISIISGNILTTTVDIGNFVKFNKVFLSDLSTVEIISVTDTEGNEYYEVPNLSQNIVYRSILNNDDKNSLSKYTLKAVSAQRRFVFDFDFGIPYLLFGGKQYKPDEDLTINPIAEPSKFIINRYNNDFLQDTFFEPHKLLNGDNVGVGPDSTTLTITYRRNLSQLNTANTGEIINVSNLLYSTPPNIATEKLETIISNIQVINEEPIIGENLQLTGDEIKDIAGMVYQAQNRAVTAKDYEALCYMLPAKYGSIKKARAERDPRSLKNNINIYLACSDINGKLAAPNTKIKENIKTWLSGYKIITDTVDLIDAKIINLSINYTIRVDPEYDKLSVYNSVQDRLINYYNNKPDIGEHFDITNIYREIQKIDGVLEIKSVDVLGKNSSGYSSLFFNTQQNKTKDGSMIMIPRNAIYEIKYPSVDIIGKVL